MTDSLASWAAPAVVALALAVALARPRRTLDEVRESGPWLARGAAALAAAGLAAAAIAVAAGRYLEFGAYARTTLAGTASFVALAFLFRRLGISPRTVLDRLARIRPGWAAAGVFAAALAAGLLALEGVPHVSDEVAYQFQARAHALGRLWIEAPSLPEFFEHTHTLVDGERWYGIMNPGWPLVLAIGTAVGAPWAVAPLLAAATVVLLFAFYRRAGLDAIESRVALLFVVVSPFFVFMSGSYMAHPASLFAFVGFCWAWIRHREDEGHGWAVAAGAFLALGLLVRPVDAAISALPFLGVSAWGVLRRPRRWVGVAILGLVASTGVWATLLYNRALTGDALEFPMTRYFDIHTPGERFGLGFGEDMGTRLHGPEWPGYAPLDAIPVSSYRIAEFLGDLHALPVVLLAVLAWTLVRHRSRRSVPETALAASAAGLVLVYGLHFYHGVAYGSRHFYLAVPAVAALVARPVVGWVRDARHGVAALAAAGLVAALAHTALFAYPPLVRSYSDAYRGSSGWVREATREAGLRDALVFVEPGGWSWKSAFPLNELPLDENDILFARDLGPRNPELVAAYPDRVAYRLGRGDGEPVLERLGRGAP